MHHVRSSIISVQSPDADDDEPRSPSSPSSGSSAPDTGRISLEEARAQLQHASTWNPKGAAVTPKGAAVRGARKSIYASNSASSHQLTSCSTIHMSSSRFVREASRESYKAVLAELNRRHREIDDVRRLVCSFDLCETNTACAQDEFGMTPIMHAVRYGLDSVVADLLKYAGTRQIFIRDKHNRTALHWAALEGQSGIAASLLEVEMGAHAAAQLLIRDAHGHTPALLSVLKGKRKRDFMLVLLHSAHFVHLLVSPSLVDDDIGSVCKYVPTLIGSKEAKAALILATENPLICALKLSFALEEMSSIISVHDAEGAKMLLSESHQLDEIACALISVTYFASKAKQKELVDGTFCSVLLEQSCMQARPYAASGPLPSDRRRAARASRWRCC